MPAAIAARKYGRSSKRSKAERLFAELPQSPVRVDPLSCLAGKLDALHIQSDAGKRRVERQPPSPRREQLPPPPPPPPPSSSSSSSPRNQSTSPLQNSLRVLTWEDVCPAGDDIVKIAEASYAEVYRVSNARGTSIIKAIRLDSPIKRQTKAQVRAGLVDEEPHAEADVDGELQVSEWLADVPGFVVYKEKYLVRGKATSRLLETHRAFQLRMKRQDPGRAQFYPSPSRYLDDTSFLVVELGDAGTALEDWQVQDESQLWDIFLLEAVALARAENLAKFEHRDLHEGNICVRRVSSPQQRDGDGDGFFGYSGLDMTILDYGLSRAQNPADDEAKPVAFDLERDLGLFSSTHASQCVVYRRMRSFLLRRDRKCIPPDGHKTPYAKGVDGPLSWDVYAPYTNVLWLAYLYRYLADSFRGNKRDLTRFKRETKEMWRHLNPDAADEVLCFGSAADVVGFAVEAGWIRQDQLVGTGASLPDKEDSIILVSRGEDERVGRPPRRSRRGGTAS
ncbi:Serine/threonine-protein kinase haspin-like protein hrk1 [Ophiocordyceps camponoti-floridani]|uniref:non-specific serine/threonine protein kinase n=1 Tax=Ophiocordyceps camponoti-floridani TaxID=2030778 RepID=A0A8H4Q1G8_9HYPO|nr:Serine/threonine-protein kinase haspin-like protein hrk1 [Ophiocordyceps camponoti-floridani]